MTIYSLHPSRGKVQILATYRGVKGLTSSTVTSVADTGIALPIVDALNRVSTYATFPISVYDRRGGGFEHYPTEHLAALTDRDRRGQLLKGSYSLWYELVMVFLHKALADLDIAAAAAPPPVQTAIDAELAADANALSVELAEYSEGIEPPDEESRRLWEHEAPLVDPQDDLGILSERTRESLNDAEKDANTSDILRASGDLQILLQAYFEDVHGHVRFEAGDLSIFAEHDFEEKYYLTIDTPPVGSARRRGWRIEIARWEPTGPLDDDGEASSFGGDPLLACVQAVPPTPSEIVNLLRLVAEQPDQLEAWSTTQVGERLVGTTFVVTEN
jgi:hypothetical protein